MSKGMGILLVVLLLGALGVGGYSVVKLQAAGDGETSARTALARLERKLADLEARVADGRVNDLDHRVQELSDELRLVGESVREQRREPERLDSTAPKPAAAAAVKDAAPDAGESVAAVRTADVDPYGISVPAEMDRQIRAIYGRIQDEERAKRREQEAKRREDGVRDRVDQLATELGLSAPQKTGVERILLDESRKRAELFAQGDNRDGGRDGGRSNRGFRQMGDDMRRISEERDAALQTVLDFDQMKRFRESDTRRQRFWGGGPGGPPPGENGG